MKRLIKIVRQYEVIYGGGISSGDASVREECSRLVGDLEEEIVLFEKGSRRPAVAKVSELGSDSPKKPDAQPKLPEKKPAPVKLPRKKVDREAEEIRTKSGVREEVASIISQAPKTVLARKAVSPKPTAVSKKPEQKSALKGGSPKPAEKLQEERKQVSGKNPPVAVAAKKEPQAEPARRFPALHLFDAYVQNKLPKYGGFIVCVRFQNDSGYTRFEVVGYENLQDIYPDRESLMFKSVGCKMYALVEPPNYYQKSVEPVNRSNDEMVPYRFSELTRVQTKRFQNIYIGKKPVFMPSSFSIYKPTGQDLAVLFYDIADVYINIMDFIIMILRDRLRVPVIDARKAGEVIARGVREFKLWMDKE